jgi:hypothetical protein
MAEINVFELTNTALKELANQSTPAKKSVKESVKKVSSKKMKKESKEMKKISYKNLKLESLKAFKEAEENGDDFEYTPDDEVVLVIDTEMEEVPESEEDAVAAAEELVGDTVCKCSICGANYVCDCETMEEDVDGEATMVADESTCPVCGGEGTQIVVGTIVADEAPVEEPVEDETEEETDVEVSDDGEDVEISDDEFDFEDEDFEESCNAKKSKKNDDVEEACDNKAKAREAIRREAMRRNRMKTRQEGMKKPMSMRRPMKRTATEGRKALNRKPAMENKRPMRKSSISYQFNEKALNRLFNKFATENYSNVKDVKFVKGTSNVNKLTLEGIVTTVKGSKRKITLVAEGLKTVRNNRISLKAIERGPFTECAKRVKNRASFVIECAVRGNMINPIAMKYSFQTTSGNLRESKGSIYEVKGIVR